jgi:hypothetical protein
LNYGLRKARRTGPSPIDTYKAAITAITPVTVGLPFARSAAVVRRDWQLKNARETPLKIHVRHSLTSLGPGESQRIPAARSAVANSIWGPFRPFAKNNFRNS